MEIFQVIGFALIAAFFLVILREQRPEIALPLSLAAGVIIFLLVLSKIGEILTVLSELAQRADLNRFYLATLLKIVGIAYIAEFGAQVCRDAGEEAVATRVEFAAKILVVFLALPIVVAVLESIVRLLP